MRWLALRLEGNFIRSQLWVIQENMVRWLLGLRERWLAWRLEGNFVRSGWVHRLCLTVRAAVD